VLADGEQGVGQREAEKGECEDVKSVYGMHVPEDATAGRGAATFSASWGDAEWTRRPCLRYDTAMRRAEPLVEMRIWVPQSLRDFIQAEAERRELSRSSFVRFYFAQYKEREEAKR
jgi:hypothetical protein